MAAFRRTYFETCLYRPGAHMHEEKGREESTPSTSFQLNLYTQHTLRADKQNAHDCSVGSQRLSSRSINRSVSIHSTYFICTHTTVYDICLLFGAQCSQ